MMVLFILVEITIPLYHKQSPKSKFQISQLQFLNNLHNSTSNGRSPLPSKQAAERLANYGRLGVGRVKGQKVTWRLFLWCWRFRWMGTSYRRRCLRWLPLGSWSPCRHFCSICLAFWCFWKLEDQSWRSRKWLVVFGKLFGFAKRVRRGWGWAYISHFLISFLDFIIKFWMIFYALLFC